MQFLPSFPVYNGFDVSASAFVRSYSVDAALFPQISSAGTTVTFDPYFVDHRHLNGTISVEQMRDIRYTVDFHDASTGARRLRLERILLHCCRLETQSYLGRVAIIWSNEEPNPPLRVAQLLPTVSRQETEHLFTEWNAREVRVWVKGPMIAAVPDLAPEFIMVESDLRFLKVLYKRRYWTTDSRRRSDPQPEAIRCAADLPRGFWEQLGRDGNITISLYKALEAYDESPATGHF